MYGAYKNKVAINIPDALRPGVVVPSQRAAGDAQLSLDDSTWGWGVNLGMLYEFTPGTRLSFTWNSQVDLDFSAPAQFSNLGNFGATLQSKGLLNPAVEVGIKVPQQLMVSMFHQVNDRREGTDRGAVAESDLGKAPGGHVDPAGVIDQITGRGVVPRVSISSTPSQTVLVRCRRASQARMQC